MNKYSNKIITDYIYANDIEGYSIDELENDAYFMSLVLIKSNDKNLYKLCSNKVKKNIEFTKMVITQFIDDIEFITDVFNYCFDNLSDDNSKILLAVHTKKLISNKKCSLNDTIDNYLDSIYIKLEIEGDILKYSSNKQDFLGRNFVVIYDYFKNEKEILDYFAKRILDDLFTDKGENIVSILLEKISNCSNLDKDNLNKLLINLVANYDKMLAYYLKENKDLLNSYFNNLYNEINKYKYNSSNKVEIIFDYVYGYTGQRPDCYIDPMEMLIDIGNEYNMLDEILKYKNNLLNNYEDEFYDLTSYYIETPDETINLSESEELELYNEIGYPSVDVYGLNSINFDYYINMKNNVKKILMNQNPIISEDYYDSYVETKYQKKK